MTHYLNSITGEIKSQAEIELEDGKRDWRKRKKMSIKVAQLMANYDPERAATIRYCGTRLEFAVTPDGERKLHQANFCRQRLCPMCQWRRSIKLRWQADQIYKAETDQGYKHLFLTLTVRNVKGDELPKETDELIEAAQRWKRTELYKKAFIGSYRALEITYNEEEDTYHPHLHYLMTVGGNYFEKSNPNYVTKDKLIKSWREAARLDYDPSVSIEAIRQKPGQSITSACAEVCKYPAKTAEINDWHVLENIDKALRKRRLIQWAGVTAETRKALELDDVEKGNLIHTANEELEGVTIEKIVYIWRYGFYIPYEYQNRVTD